MAEKPAIYTFHKVREFGEQGNADAWRAFLNLYGPLCLRQVDLYFPGDSAAATALLERLLERLTENDFARFRAMPRQSEREFLIDVRALLLDLAAQEASARAGAPGGERVIDMEKLEKLLADLPLMHQEILFFKLSGYTDPTIESMLRVGPRVAEKAMERLAATHGAALKLEHDGCPWPADWLSVLQYARAAKKEDCKALHEFMRIQDGQVSWYEKEPIEKHVATCPYCLERWAALREVVYGRRVAQPLKAEEVERLLGAVPIAAPAKKSLLKRVFG
jgi:hypothetical protein